MPRLPIPNCEINELLEIMVEYHNKAETCHKDSDEREDTLTRLYEEVQAARGERVAANLSKQCVGKGPVPGKIYVEDDFEECLEEFLQDVPDMNYS